MRAERSRGDVTVAMRGVSKRFGAVQALDDCGLTVRQGDIHAVVGENGAGKTTLMRILYGAIAPDAGSIEIRGERSHFASAADGIRAGIGMVSQHYGIIGELTCLENLMLGAEPGALLSYRAARSRAQSLAETMGFAFDWGAEASLLSPSGAQKLEILKLLWKDAQVMILDEPTAMLSPGESDALFTSLRKLAERGATVILVTHRLPEVMSHCDRVTVLRQGRLIAELDVADSDEARLAELIVGHALEDVAAPSPSESKEVALEVRDLTVSGYRGDNAVECASFEVRKGEVLGIAGVDGSGQRELFWCLTGVQKARSGSLTFQGIELAKLSTKDRIKLGIRLIPEDRHGEGLVDEWSLELNAALGLQRLRPLARGAFVDSAGRIEFAMAALDRFQTRCVDVHQRLRELSGGNQQRFVAGRALTLDPRLILAFQPARGLDIDASRAVYSVIRDSVARGAIALVVSFDLDELLSFCDRIVVMRGGRVFEPPQGRERDRGAIGQLMVGAA